MPPIHTDEGVQAARVIREEVLGAGVVVLSADLEAAPALELLGDDPAGVGYLLKDRVWDGDHFTEAVRRLAEGGLSARCRGRHAHAWAPRAARAGGSVHA